MADRVLVAVGMKCPRPLFEVSKSIKAMEKGQTLEIQADDPAFKPDIEAWCRRTGNTLVDLKKEGDRFSALVRRDA
jgi:tRNA 2-thiouridine synthesizing protein A